MEWERVTESVTKVCDFGALSRETMRMRIRILVLIADVNNLHDCARECVVCVYVEVVFGLWE